MARPLISRSRSTTPTMKPARSYSPSCVETRHLRGLAAEQRAAVVAAGVRHPADDRFRDVRRQPAGREVVEEEQRLGALHEDVVDAVVDEIDADGVVARRHERDLQLGADAVGARDENGIAKASGLEPEQTAERADVREDAGRERRTRQRPDPADGFVARIDVDAGGLVVHASLELESLDEQSSQRTACPSRPPPSSRRRAPPRRTAPRRNPLRGRRTRPSAARWRRRATAATRGRATQS